MPDIAPAPPSSVVQAAITIEGIRRVLSEVDTEVCVASSSTRSALNLKLRRTGLLRFFDNRVFSSDMVARGKPHPDLFLLAAKHCGVRPSDCLVIEDSVAGIQAARSARMRVWGFVGASHCTSAYKARISSMRPEVVFQDMARLKDLLCGRIAYEL